MNNQSGYVYLLKNEAMPGIYKIGMTNRDVKDRVKELSLSTSVPLPFEVVCSVKVDNPIEVESDLHEKFSEFRISKSREFFRFDEKMLKKVVAKYFEYTMDKFFDLTMEFEKNLSSLEFNDVKDKMLFVTDIMGYGEIEDDDENIDYEKSELSEPNVGLLNLAEDVYNRKGRVFIPLASYRPCWEKEYKEVIKECVEKEYMKGYIKCAFKEYDPLNLKELLEE